MVPPPALAPPAVLELPAAALPPPGGCIAPAPPPVAPAPTPAVPACEGLPTSSGVATSEQASADTSVTQVTTPNPIERLVVMVHPNAKFRRDAKRARSSLLECQLTALAGHKSAPHAEMVGRRRRADARVGRVREIPQGKVAWTGRIGRPPMSH